MKLIPFNGNARGRHSLRAPRHPVVLAVFLIAVSVFRALAQPSAREYDVKATLLFNFCQFVEWPESSLSDTNLPFVIGILGSDPFGTFLDELVEGERVEGKTVQVQRFHRVEETFGAHILFVSKSEHSRLDSILPGLKGKPILTVSDATERAFAFRGGMVGLVTEKGSVRLRINLESATSSGLVISAKLLSLAEIVRTGGT